MSFKRIDENLNIHQSLPDQPTLEAQELKQKFDEAANIIKDYINNTFLPELEEKGTFSEGDVYTYTKKILAQGGIEGDVKGNLEGNVTGSCSGNARNSN